MKAEQLLEVFSRLDRTKRIKFQNRTGWDNSTMAVNAIIEPGGIHLLIWGCHPKLVKEDLKDGQKLIWYNPNCRNAKLVKTIFLNIILLIFFLVILEKYTIWFK